MHGTLILLPAVLLLAYMWWQPVNKLHAWNRVSGNCYKAICNYNMLLDSTAIDIAFIGSSRTICTIDQTTLSQNWNAHVVNLGHCRYGRNLQYEYAKLLFQHHLPKHVFIEINQDEDWYGHYDYGNVTHVSDILSNNPLSNVKLFRDVKTNFRASFDLWQRNLLNNPYPVSNCLNGFGPRTDKTPNLVPFTKAPVNSPKQRAYSEYFLEKIIALCQKNECSFSFIYLPAYGLLDQPPNHIDYYTAKAPIVYLPDSLDQHKFWADQSHLNQKASEVVTTVLTHHGFDQ